jgi:hypothetical protein
MMSKYFNDGSGPDLSASDNNVTDAQKDLKKAQMIEAAGNASDCILSALSPTVVLQNRMQDLGKAPDMAAARQFKNDNSSLREQAEKRLLGANQSRDADLQAALQARKDELAQIAAGNKEAEEARRWNAEQEHRKEREAKDDENRIITQGFERAKIQEMIRGNKIKESLDTAKITEGKKPKPLSPDAAVKLANFKNALDSIDEMKKALKNNDNTFTLYGDNDFTIAQDKFAEGYGRGSSGASITEAERNSFKNRTPNVWNDQEEQEKKLDAMRQDVLMKIQALNAGNDASETTGGGSSPKVKVISSVDDLP